MPIAFPSPSYSDGERITTSSSHSRPATILCALTIFSAFGIAFSLWLGTVPAGNPDPRAWFNVFYVLFARNEPAGLAVVGLFNAISALWILHARDSSGRSDSAAKIDNHQRTRWVAIAIAVAVFAVTAAGTYLVFHNYALTADENMADFQARIFLRGQVQAQVAEQWWPAVRPLRPTFVQYFPQTHRWNSPYYPVYAAMRAVFQSVHLQSLLNPFFAGLSILALYGVTRNLWPNCLTNALVAVALLASSSQFLLMAMTAYAMPAHLALNLVWLWLYTRPECRRFYLAPFVGVLAMGLHQPIVHVLFAAPFLVRLVLQRRWKPVFVFAAIYFIGCVGCWIWRAHFQSPAAGGLSAFFKVLNPRMAIIQPMNLLLVIGWGSLAMPLLAALGFARFFRLPTLLQDAAISCALTFAFYYFFYLDQAHGWGYRYLHGALGCLVLIAVAGWDSLNRIVGAKRAQRFLIAAVAASVFVLLPLRSFQAESFTRPFAHTAAALHSLSTGAVALDPRDAWYAADLIRNDPFLENRPLVVSLQRLTPDATPTLSSGRTTQLADRGMLAGFGLFTQRRDDYARDPFRLGRGR